MIRTTIVLILLGIAAYVAYVIVSSYLASSGTVRERLLATSQNSATILWSKFVMLLGFATAGMDFVADLLGMPEVKDMIQSVMKPQYVAVFVVAVAAITILARKRTM